MGTMEEMDESSRTELDSHVNMPVIGKNAYILSIIGETVDVAPFTPDYKPIRVELVDAALKYECPYSGETKIFDHQKRTTCSIHVQQPTTTIHVEGGWNYHQ